MRQYILRRVGLALLALWALATVIFALVELGGGDAALAALPGNTAPAEIERLREELGLNRPGFVRYFAFLGNGLTGDYGVFGYGTPYEQPVVGMILEPLPYTLVFIAVIMGLSTVVGMFYGVLLEMGKGALARAVRIVALVGWSVPLFVASLLLFYLEVRLGIRPVASGIWWHLLGPGIAACFQATVLIQLANRPATPESGLDWRTAWRRSAHWVAATHHTHFTLIVGYLLIWLVLSGSIFRHSHIGGFAWIPVYVPSALAAEAWAIGLGAAHTYFLPVLAAATLVLGTLYIVVHLLLDVGVAWATLHGEKPDDAEANGIARIAEPPADTTTTTTRRGGLTALVRRRPIPASALILILLLLIPMLLAGLIAPHDPNQVSFDNRVLPPFWVDGEHGDGSAKHLLGTDKLGRDILSRLIHGVGKTLRSAVFPIFCAGLLGIAVGVASGSRVSWVAAAASLPENVLVYLPAAFIMALAGTSRWPRPLAVVYSRGSVALSPLRPSSASCSSGGTGERDASAARHISERHCADHNQHRANYHTDNHREFSWDGGSAAKCGVGADGGRWAGSDCVSVVGVAVSCAGHHAGSVEHESAGRLGAAPARSETVAGVAARSGRRFPAGDGVGVGNWRAGNEDDECWDRVDAGSPRINRFT